MFSRRRMSQAAERAKERRDREDSSTRLLEACPGLSNLQLDVTEYFGERRTIAGKHVRHIVVAHAPALFLIGCSDSSCQDGGYDLTSEILRSLKSRQTRFEGEQSCCGHVGSAECRRVLTFVAVAVYGAG